MLMSKQCTMCKPTHHVMFICSKCHGTIGHTNLHDVNWKYCPFCGEKLYPDGLNLDQRIEFSNKLFRGEFPMSETR